jgi:N-acetyl-anhydromuramyl-L-alanine amidase AmpD
VAKVSPKRLAYKLAAYGVKHRFKIGWDSERIDPYKGASDFRGVLLHHTAGRDSERYIAFTNPYAPVRASHFLVRRDGEVVVMSGTGAYHAGRGGPVEFPNGTERFIARDMGNRHLYGIEIESLGRTGKINGKAGGMTVEQVVQCAMLCAALLNAMRKGPFSKPVNRVIRHRDWTSRKIDVRQDLEWWHQVIGIARRNRRNPGKAERLIREFVEKYPNGVIPS